MRTVDPYIFYYFLNAHANLNKTFGADGQYSTKIIYNHRLSLANYFQRLEFSKNTGILPKI